MSDERKYSFEGLINRLTSDAWAVGRVKQPSGRHRYFFLPAGYRDHALYWRNHHGM